MDKFLFTMCGLFAFAILLLIDFPESAVTLTVVAGLSAVAILTFRSLSPDKAFVTNVFLGALLIRLAFGILIHIFGLREFFGGDAITYSTRGWELAQYWRGVLPALSEGALRSINFNSPGWGMFYLVGSFFFVFGKAIFLMQSFCAVVGAATAPMIYLCAKKLFQNSRVARFSALSIAFFPSFVIWSAQLMKDGLIIFLLVLAITLVLELNEKFSLLAILGIVLALFGIISLRFYIFYMAAAAVVGSFVVGVSRSNQSIIRRVLVIALIGVGLSYFGVSQTATKNVEVYGDLSRLQNSRLDLARSAGSGFNEDADVSTTRGAISAIPLGLAYLMLAPFPWEMTNFRQLITLPEVLLWWAMIPLMIYGIWYAVRNKFRHALPILLFSGMLTLAYSIFQGNVGTAYRQRTQIQVFLFIFIAVGWTIWREKREDRELIRKARLRMMPHPFEPPRGV